MANASQLYRSDFFPGLGWMLNARVWDSVKDTWRVACLWGRGSCWGQLGRQFAACRAWDVVGRSRLRLLNTSPQRLCVPLHAGPAATGTTPCAFRRHSITSSALSSLPRRPKGYWDDYMRLSTTRRGRQCIRCAETLPLARRAHSLLLRRG